LELRTVLEKMIELGASDLHLRVGCRPIIRVDGELREIDMDTLTVQDSKDAIRKVLNAKQQEQFIQHREIDFALGVAGLARFRVNVYLQRGNIAMAFRRVSIQIPTLEKLNLPPKLADIAMKERGMILVTGTTGSGKSTTLAALIERINSNRICNIITIEDPIEFLHVNDKSYISQREIGTDTESFSTSLRHILRQDPDIIMIGEIRDMDSMSVALTAADTGHLVLSTLHTINAAETVHRIISFFPLHQHEQVRLLLASTLQAIISLRLLPRTDRKGRVPVTEIMLVTGAIRECILDPQKTMEIPDYIKKGASQYGMQTFDQSLLKLFKEGVISYREAIRTSANPDEFNLIVQGIQGADEETWKSFDKQEDSYQ
jgi:twitching motility protein PilT